MQAINPCLPHISATRTSCSGAADAIRGFGAIIYALRDKWQSISTDSA